MQHRVMFLPALHPVGKHRAVRKGLASPPRGAVVSSVCSSPVETQNTSFSILDNSHLVLEAEVLEGGTHIESGPIEVGVAGRGDFVLEVASWARRPGRLRGRRVGLVAILLLGTLAPVTPSDSGLMTRLATIGTLTLLASLLFGDIFLGRMHPLLGLL